MISLSKKHATSSVETEPKMKLTYLYINFKYAKCDNSCNKAYEKYEKAVVKMSNISKQLSPIRTEAAKYAV